MSKRQPAADRGGDPTIAHGTVYAYNKKGCRCEACKTVGREWNRNLPSRQPGKRKTTASPGRPMPETAHGTESGWGYWRCTCDACTERKRFIGAQHRARRKAEAAPTAVNAGKPWTEDDSAVLASLDIPDLEAAKILGRTVAAVTTRRHQMRKRQEWLP